MVSYSRDFELEQENNRKTFWRAIDNMNEVFWSAVERRAANNDPKMQELWAIHQESKKLNPEEHPEKFVSIDPDTFMRWYSAPFCDPEP